MVELGRQQESIELDIVGRQLRQHVWDVDVREDEDEDEDDDEAVARLALRLGAVRSLMLSPSPILLYAILAIPGTDNPHLADALIQTYAAHGRLPTLLHHCAQHELQSTGVSPCWVRIFRRGRRFTPTVSMTIGPALTLAYGMLALACRSPPSTVD